MLADSCEFSEYVNSYCIYFLNIIFNVQLFQDMLKIRYEFFSHMKHFPFKYCSFIWKESPEILLERSDVHDVQAWHQGVVFACF
jgi:hypothetical protein